MVSVEWLARRDGWRCRYCRFYMDETTATRDHVIPRSRGGRGHSTNVVLACVECNTAKADAELAVFLRSAWLRARRIDVECNGATCRRVGRRSAPARAATVKPLRPFTQSCPHRKGEGVFCSNCIVGERTYARRWLRAS